MSINDEFDLDVWGRNCDRAVEWSTAFEGVEQLPSLLLGDAFHPEAQAHGVEERDVRAGRPGTVHRAGDLAASAMGR